MDLIEVKAEQPIEGISQEAINQHASAGRCWLFKSSQGPVLLRKPKSTEIAAFLIAIKSYGRGPDGLNSKPVKQAARSLNLACALWPDRAALLPLLESPDLSGSLASELCELFGLKKPKAA